jgi:serine protease inhibitor
MKTIIPLFCLMFISLLSCNQQSTDTPAPVPTPTIDCSDNPEACDITKSNNTFGFKLFQKLHDDAPEANVFISPLSVATALSMTINGAKGQTLEDMMATLEQNGMTLEQVNEGFRQLLLLLPALDPQVQIQLANSIWHREGYPVRQSFLDVNEANYDSEVAGLDFSDPIAREIINNWIDENTNGLINSIIDEPIPGDVIMYLINAIYFKGAWLYEFDPEYTYETAFRLEDGSTTMVDMMSYGETLLNFFETETFLAADLPYGDSVYTMTVMLPNTGKTVDDIIAELNNVNWDDWSDDYVYTDVSFGMPKFEMEYKESLVKVLTQLGMGIAFSPACDLTGIADASLSIDDVIHKSFIEVTEEGTEAAAVTSVVIIETSVPQIPTMLLDRPFVFIIRENQTNNVLFIGKLMNPQE